MASDRPSSERLPYEVRKALIQACGKAFWLKDVLRDFMLSSGVPVSAVDRYMHEAKFQIARHVLEELDRLGGEGYLIQRKLLTDLSRLTRLPDDTVEDLASGQLALATLRNLCFEHDLVQREEKRDSGARRRAAEMKAEGVRRRAEKARELHARFLDLARATDDPQAKGYALESLLADMFDLEEIDYRRSYKTTADQVDGAFKLDSFDYLVEARWRATYPSLADLEAFRAKVDRRIESTRGLFVSIAGFRPEIVTAFGGRRSNVVLADGADLALVLEGQISLRQALELKTRKAAQEGVVFFELRHALVG